MEKKAIFRSYSKLSRVGQLLISLLLMSLILWPTAARIGSYAWNRWVLQTTPEVLHQHEISASSNWRKNFQLFKDSPLANLLLHRERDAGPALNRKLDWIDNSSSFELEALSPVSGAIPTGADFANSCQDFPECGADAFKDLHLPTNAFDIFSQAMEYDHWSLDSNSPIETVATSKNPLPAIKPHPDWLRFRGLLRAYLLTATSAADASALQVALLQAEHFGELLLTQNSLDSIQQGAEILHDTQSIYNLARTQALLLSKEQRLSQDDIQLFKSSIASTVELLLPMHSLVQLQEVLHEDKKHILVCPAATLAWGRKNASLLVFADEYFPGEDDYRPYVAEIEKFFSDDSPCNLPFEARSWRERKENVNQRLARFSYFPWLRKSMLMTFFIQPSMAANFFK